MDVLDIPGYLQAIRKERLVRDAAFLGITESVGPFEVLPLTLFHFTVLRLVNSPFLTGETPTPQELGAFLWLLNPRWTQKGRLRKWWFMRRCRRLFFPPRYMAVFNTRSARARHEVRKDRRMVVAAKLIDAVRAFMAEAQQDRQPVQLTMGYDPDYYSDAAFFCALFGREFGWPPSETLRMPMKQIYQYLNEMKQASGSKVPLCNPSDAIKAAWAREFNRTKPQSKNG